MQLRELIKKIRNEKGWTQAAMAAEYGVKQQDIQGMENAGRNLEKQFSIFLKLMDTCKDLRINPAQPLNNPTYTAERIVHDLRIKAVGQTDKERTNKTQKGSVGTISSRRNRS